MILNTCAYIRVYLGSTYLPFWLDQKEPFKFTVRRRCHRLNRFFVYQLWNVWKLVSQYYTCIWKSILMIIWRIETLFLFIYLFIFKSVFWTTHNQIAIENFFSSRLFKVFACFMRYIYVYFMFYFNFDFTFKLQFFISKTFRFRNFILTEPIYFFFYRFRSRTWLQGISDYTAPKFSTDLL